VPGRPPSIAPHLRLFDSDSRAINVNTSIIGVPSAPVVFEVDSATDVSTPDAGVTSAISISHDLTSATVFNSTDTLSATK
jgi:hypothetical protein